MLQTKELKIIANLRTNARMPLTEMSKNTRIPVSTIFKTLKQQEDNLILKNTCLIDFNKLGYGSRANILLKINKEQREDINNFLIKNPNINNVFKVNNGYDYLIEVIFKNISDLEDFLEIIDEKFIINDKKVLYIINEIKREGFMTNQDLLNIIK